jgi:hypothetical protein
VKQRPNKSWFFEKINEIDKTLANLTKMRREKTQICKIRYVKGEIITNKNLIQRIIRDSFENLYSNKLENPEEMNKFLVTYEYPKLNQENINHLNRSITCNEVEVTIECPKKRKVQGLMDSSLNSTRPLQNTYQHFLNFSMK